MKKIIVAFDGLKFSASTCEYAIHLCKLANVHLVGIFLEDFTYTSYKIYELTTKNGISDEIVKQYEDKDKKTRDKAVANFEDACQNASLSYSIHHDRNIALQELLHESIYADLLIINSNETLSHYDESAPTRFIRDLLTDVQCPVLLVPQKYKSIDNIFLLYDGEPSSIYAIKMFSYLFPFLKHLDTEVITVKYPHQSLHIPDNKLMKEFIKRHYPKAVYKVLKGLPEVEIAQYMNEQSPNVLVVLGAYRRGLVSRWFRVSMADVMMKELKAPLFVAHNK